MVGCPLLLFWLPLSLLSDSEADDVKKGLFAVIVGCGLMSFIDIEWLLLELVGADSVLLLLLLLLLLMLIGCRYWWSHVCCM